MNTGQVIENFFGSAAAKNVKERDLLYSIITSLQMDSPILYDLTFHAAFAKRIFDIIKREGPQTQGFQRMQQSFIESVEKIKEILMTYEKDTLIPTSML